MYTPLFIYILLGLGCLFLIWIKIRRRIRLRSSSTNADIRRETTRTLQNAISLQAIFDIHTGDGQQSKLRGYGIALTKDALIVDVDEASAATTWKGREVEVFFYENPKTPTSLYGFAGSVLQVNVSEGRHKLHIEIPEVLHTTQRRQFVRLQTEEIAVVDIRIWLGMRVVSGKGSSPLHMPAPDIDSLEISGIQVENISAGGMSLHLPSLFKKPLDSLETKVKEQTAKEETASSETIVPLVLRLTLRGVAEDPLQVLWFSGKVVNRREQEDGFSLGILFLFWAHDEEGLNRLTWTRVNPQLGVAPLEKWVMRRHHAMHSKNTQETGEQ